jgi:hypothetical protein
MAVVLAAFVTLACREVPLLRTGSELAQAAADQIADLFAQPSVEGAEERRRFETGPEIRPYLKYGGEGATAVGLSALQTRDNQIVFADNVTAIQDAPMGSSGTAPA